MADAETDYHGLTGDIVDVFKDISPLGTLGLSDEEIVAVWFEQKNNITASNQMELATKLARAVMNCKKQINQKHRNRVE